MDKRYYDATSVLKQWEIDNRGMVTHYIKEHGWLKADVEKLAHYARRNRICMLAITATDVFGVDASGMIHCAGRWALGVQDNYY